MQKRGSLAILLTDLPLLLLLLQVLLALLGDLLGARDLWALQKVVAGPALRLLMYLYLGIFSHVMLSHSLEQDVARPVFHIFAASSIVFKFIIQGILAFL